MSRGNERQPEQHPAPQPQPVAAPMVSDRRSRIDALLAARGAKVQWDAPLPTAIHHAGTQTGRLCGADVDPSLEYVRVNANQTDTMRRYMDRGYVPVDPNKDVYIDNCRGPDDVMMAARKDVIAQAAAIRKQRRNERRGRGRTEDGATYTSTEGRWVAPSR